MAFNNPGSSNNIAGALTYPASNSQIEPMAEQPRQPRTLQGLLRFAMEATKAEDAPGNSELGPMDDERRRFLSEALNAQTVQVNEILSKNIKILSEMEKLSSIKKDDPLPEEILIAFQELGEFIDDIDVANDFEKMGGFIIFRMCYSCESIELHRWANRTLALVCQNNPHCQDQALRSSLLPVVLNRLRHDKDNNMSVRALSSMIRNYEPALTAFVAQGGCELLVDCLRDTQHPELGSAGFLISYLCKNSKEARDIFIKQNIVQAILDILKGRRLHVSEYLLNILVTLVEQQPAEVLPIYRDPTLDFRRTLENHLQITDVMNGTLIEEKEYCEKIIQLAFGNQMNGNVEGDSGDVEPADR